jgi:rhodanese-related sulfurtransferase
VVKETLMPLRVSHSKARWGLAVLGFLVLLTGCRTDETGSGRGVERVDVEVFSQRAEQGDRILLDVRTPAEFEAGHIPGAVNLDIQSPSFATELGTLDRNARYLVYCRSGRRSARACDMMVEMGFIDLTDLAPGFNGWTSGGKPVER